MGKFGSSTIRNIMILHYLKMAFRSIGRYRMQNIISVICLAIALFCFSLNLYFSRFLFSVDNWMDSQVVYLSGKNEYQVNRNDLERFAKERPEVRSVCRIYNESLQWWPASDKSVTGGQIDYFVHTDTSMADVLRLKVLAGSWKDVCEGENSLAVSKWFAKKHWGSAQDALGHVIKIGLYETDYTVRAVLEDLPYANSITELAPNAGWLVSRDPKMPDVTKALARLHDGVDPDLFVSGLPKNNSHFVDAVTLPPVKVHPDSIFKQGLLLLLLSLPGLMILVVSLFSYFHLLLNSILTGSKGYLLRRIHGARTFDIWMMVSVQIVVTTFITALLSMLITIYVTPLITYKESFGFLDGVVKLSIDTGTMLRHTAQYSILLMAGGFLMAWIAVNRIRRMQMNRVTTMRHGVRNTMLGIQLTVAQLSLLLLVTLCYKTRSNIDNPYPWLSREDKSCIISDMVTMDGKSRIQEAKKYLKTIPFITHVSVMPSAFLCESGRMSFMNGSDEQECPYVILERDYLDVIGVEISNGRFPSKWDEIMIDDLFAREYGVSVGDVIMFNNFIVDLPEDAYIRNGLMSNVILKVVGQVDNLLAQSGTSLSSAVYFNSVDQLENASVIVRCLPGKQEDTKVVLGRMHFPEMDQDNPIFMELTRSLYDNLSTRNIIWESMGFIVWMIAVIALLVTMLGIYSAITVDTSNRRKEMALRKINGARTGQIAMIFTRLYIKLFIISSLVSTVISIPFIKLFMFDVPSDKKCVPIILIYLAVIVFMVLFVVLTIGSRIRRIACENPADVIKSE